MLLNPPVDDLRFGVPLYTVGEAAAALGVPVSTFATWVHGYTRQRPGGGRTTRSPLVTHVEVAGGPSVPFVGLAEGLVLAAFRRSGVPMQRIRPALEALASELGVAHALASRRLYTDGAEVLVDLAERASGVVAAEVSELVVVRSGQRVFAPVVESYLKRISFAADGFAELIHLPLYSRADVVADPRRSFGQPIFASGGARVRDALERFWAGEELSEVAEDFGVPLADLEDVVRAASRRAA